MKSLTVTATLSASPGEVFDYLASVENLPDWATEFARELIEVDGHHKVRNGLGEFYVSITADPTTGVIDMHAGPSLDQMAIFPTRVIALTPDTTAYTFTMFQQPGMPDELFEAQHASLTREFEHKRGHPWAISAAASMLSASRPKTLLGDSTQPHRRPRRSLRSWAFPSASRR